MYPGWWPVSTPLEKRRGKVPQILPLERWYIQHVQHSGIEEPPMGLPMNVSELAGESLQLPWVSRRQQPLLFQHPSQLIRELDKYETKKQKGRNVPMKILPTLVFPVSLSASQLLYDSKLANRMAILGTMPDKTAPRPLYSARGVSRFTMYAPVARNPRGFV